MELQHLDIPVQTYNNDAEHIPAGVNDKFIDYLREYIGEKSLTGLLWTDSTDEAQQKPFDDTNTGVVNLSKVNNILYINKYLESANRSLKTGQYLVICIETKNARKARFLNKYPRFISKPLYFFDFLFTRVFPKTKLTRSLYFSVTKGKDRVITRTEALGRLISCGFQLVSNQRIGYNTYIIAQKKSEPVFDLNPTYGAIVKLNRVGYKGRVIQLYKLRTMHPYSEYLQKHMYDKYGTEDGDKISNDFRVTNWGRVFRKFWIDETPMIWNWLKRDLKLVGVRPLSKHKYKTYPEYLQKKRIQVKPGLIPPYYSDLPQTPEEFFETENNYLESYFKHPIRTDLQYFWKACRNILFKGQRSR